MIWTQFLALALASVKYLMIGVPHTVTYEDYYVVSLYDLHTSFRLE